jgi:hypothetical protein
MIGFAPHSGKQHCADSGHENSIEGASAAD